MSFGKNAPPAYSPLNSEIDDGLTQTKIVGQQVFMMSTSDQHVAAQHLVWMPARPTGVHVIRPQTFVPNSYLVLTVILFVAISIFAPEALFFMVPALILSVMSHNHNELGNYAQAKCLGNGALALNFTGLITAFAVAILITALSFSFYPWNRPHEYYNAYYGCYYDYSIELGSGYDMYPMVCY